MKAIIEGHVREVPDHSRQAGRLLITTLHSARSIHKQPTLAKARLTYQLAVARRYQSLPVIRYDGVRLFWRKAAHMLRREISNRGPKCASFLGTIVDVPADYQEHSIGDLVAGISPTHPPDTGQVVARPEHVFSVSRDIDRNLAACVLYGGMSVCAVLRACQRTEGIVGIAGTGALASLVSLVLSEKRRQSRRLNDLVDGSEQQHDATVGGSQMPFVWIETDGMGAVPRPRNARAVIGIEVPRRRLEELWPMSDEHISVSTADFEQTSNDTCDLYYYDGPCDFPHWCLPSFFEEYLELIQCANGRTKPILEALSAAEIAPDSMQLKPSRRGEQDAHSVAIRVTRFPVDKRITAHRALDAPQTRRDDRKRVSLVGTGRWGIGMVARQILKDERVTVRGLCDRRPEVLHLAQQALPFEYATTRFEEILDDPMTDMILVTPYHNVHAEFAARALRADKHCYVEKPPVTSWEELVRLCEAAEQTNRMLYVGYNRRFAPATQVLKRRLLEIDGPIAFNATIRPMRIPDYKNWILWPSNGGSRIVSNLCHMLDLALYLTGDSRPCSVAVVPALRGRPEDNLGIIIRFEDDSVATILFTSKGAERKGGYNEVYRVMKGDLHAVIDNFESVSIERAGRRIDGWKGITDKGHRAQMATIAEALVHDGPAPFPVSTVRWSASMYLAVLRAVERGGTTEPVEWAADLVAAGAT